MFVAVGEDVKRGLDHLVEGVLSFLKLVPVRVVSSELVRQVDRAGKSALVIGLHRLPDLQP